MRKFLLSFIATLYLGLFSFFQARSQCEASDVTQPANQVVCAGANTTAVNFAGSVSGTSFMWTNNNPAIGLAANGSGNIPAFTATNTSTAPLTGTVTVTPYKGTKAYAYIPNAGDNNVSVIDVSTKTLVKSISVGDNPQGVVATPDGRKVYVTNANNRSVSVISTATNSVIKTILVDWNLTGIIISPDGTRVYVSGDQIRVINTSDDTVVGTITASAKGLAISPDGTRLYASSPANNTVSEINTTTLTTIKTTSVGSLPWGMAVSSDGSKLYVAISGDNRVRVLNTTDLSINGTISSTGTSPLGVALTPDGGRLYVTNRNSDNVSVINTATNTVIATIAVGQTPFGVSVNPDGTKVYVACSSSDNVIIINAVDNTVDPMPIPVGDAPLAFGNFMALVPCPGTSETFTITVNPVPDVAAISNQTACEGSASSAIAFTGLVPGTVFTWRNNYTGTGLAAYGSGSIPSFIPTRPVGTTGPAISTITVTPYTGSAAYAYVPNRNSGAVSVIDINTGSVVKTIGTSGFPYGVYPSPDGTRMYVTDNYNGRVNIINTITNTADASVTVGTSPAGVVVAPNGSKIYVTAGDHKVYVVDAVTNKVDATIAVGDRPMGIAISPDGTRLYVANQSSKNVSVINTATNAVIATIEVENSPWGVYVSSDGTKVYVSNSYSGTVSVINTSSNTLAGRITVGNTPHGIVLSADGSRAYVANHGSNTVSVINTATNTVIATINTGVDTRPVGVSLSPDGSKLYVTKSNANNVAVVDVATNTIIGTINVFAGPIGMGNMVASVPTCAGTSKTFTLTVNPLTAITTQPVARTVCAGSGATFSVGASGTGLTYQWRKDGSPISGATSSTLNLTAIASTDAGDYDVVVTGSCGSVTSSKAKLTVNVNTLITTQPTDQSVCTGTAATFAVVATGTNLVYQWTKDGAFIGGATASTYTIPAVSASDAAQYRVIVTGDCGTRSSSIVRLWVNAETTITTQPTSQTVCPGTSATFSVGASGNGTLSYQWKKGTDNISGATSATYTINNVTAADVADYSVVVTGACGSATSAVAALTINSSPAVSIATQPVSQTKCVGGSVTFSVAASGSGLTYQWKKGTVNISGATANTYTISSINAADAGDYSVLVTAACGTATSSVSSAIATLTVNAFPVITTHPTGQTVCPGADVTFSVSATGTGLTYQWKKGATNISGATSATYTIAGVTASDAANYSVVVSGTCGASISSTVAALTVSNDLVITSQPSSQVVCAGANATLSVAATGAGLTYQWKKGADNISGATSATYTISNASAAHAGNYSVVVSNSCGTLVTSNVAGLTVNPAPAVPTITASGNELSSSATTGNQWYLEGMAISGATSQTHRVQAAGQYTVKVTQGGCEATSAAYNFVATRINEPGTWNGDVVVYPTPVSTTLHIKNNGNRKLQLQLFDGFGRKVYEGQLTSTSGTIDVQQLAAGVYQLLMTDVQKNQTISQTILKN